LKRTNFLLFFILPFGGLVIIFFIVSSLNRDYVERKVEGLAAEQIEASSEILRVNVAHLIDDNVDPAKIIAISAGEESIYYLALLDNRRNILSWSSRYEGYLPLSSRDTDRTQPWIISSPVGRIFNTITPVVTAAGRTYYLYLGYALSGLDSLISRSNRNFVLVFAVLIAVGILFFLGVWALQRSFLAKTREAEEEKAEKERFREISGLTSAVAHEIKNPLNSLSLLFELLQKNAPDALREETALAKAEVRKISEIVDRFSNLLRPPQPQKARFVLRDLFAAVHESVAREIPRPEVEFRYLESAPIALYGDERLLGQCFFNLLRNAFEATAAGSVVVEASLHGRRTVIRVRDTGRGIPAEDLPAIFDPFFTTKDSGMGVGLYLAKKIIEAHAGRLEVRSEPGRGTTMTVQLPGGEHE
jgi:signal transduction histidine kinase